MFFKFLSKLGTVNGQTIRWDFFACIFGIVGIVFSFTPYLSLVGVCFAFVAIILGLIGFQAGQKNLFTWLGVLAGTFNLCFLLIVIGLVLIF